MTLPSIAHRTPVPPEQWAEVQRPAIEVGLLLALLYPDRVTWCARCHRLPACQMCWYCPAELCLPCWEDEAHCGHPGAFEEDLAAGLFDVARRVGAEAVGDPVHDGWRWPDGCVTRRCA